MTTGSQARQRSVNLALVMRALRENAPVSRTEIADRTGLTKSTVSNLVRDLASRGLVAELPESSSGNHGGRPRVALELASDGLDVAGFELRPDGVRVVTRGLTGAIRARRSYDGERERFSVGTAWQRACELLDGPPQSLLGIGVALPATVNPETGRVIHSRSFAIRDEEVDALLPVGDRPPLLVENDANALAWGALDATPRSDRPESLIAVIGRAEGTGSGADGAARGRRGGASAASTMRVGTGIVLDGRVYHGRTYEAGEFRSVRWRAGSSSELDRSGTAGLSELLESLAVPVSMLRPDRLVFGGDLAREEDAIRELLAGPLAGSYVNPDVSGCPLVAAAEGAFAIADGAARMLVERLFAVPTVDYPRPAGLPRWEEVGSRTG
jgi:DNA-binding transcriptional ArsR family regulator